MRLVPHRPAPRPLARRRPVRLVAVAVLALLAQLVAAGPSATPAGAQSSFDFVGGGFGHGVGMSQYGAKGRADAGQTTDQILGSYYPGTAITTTNPAGPG